MHVPYIKALIFAQPAPAGRTAADSAALAPGRVGLWGGPAGGPRRHL